MANNNQPITEDAITRFLDRYVPDGKDDIKALLMNIKKLKISNWADLIWSKRFRQVFKCKSEIYKKLGNDIYLFEELLIHIPLNFIYWRDGIKYKQLFPTTNQGEDPICWAHAVATCIVLARQRIIGRKAPNFIDVKKALVKEFGCKGNNTYEVLTKVLPRYKLHCSPVSQRDINPFLPNRSYHFYIATFNLTGEQWHDFSTFFADPNNEDKFLTSQDLNITPPNEIYAQNSGGHAVVLIDVDSATYTFLNSWGINWSNQGKFKVERNALPNIKFYSIYWLVSDLTDNEKQCYEFRRKHAIETFYQIIDYTNLLSTLDNEEPVFNHLRKNQETEVNKDIQEIMEKFCDDYWKEDPKKPITIQKRFPIKRTVSDPLQEPLTQDKIDLFVDKYVHDGDPTIKMKMKQLKFLTTKDWAKILVSSEFRHAFPSQNVIKNFPKKDIQYFEEIFIMNPLNYIFWRDDLSNDQSIIVDYVADEEYQWANPLAANIVLASKRILGRVSVSNDITFKNVRDYLKTRFGKIEDNYIRVLDDVLPKYKLRYDEEKKNIQLFASHGSFRVYLCSFYLLDNQWANFTKFFNESKDENPILTGDVLNNVDPNRKISYYRHSFFALLIDADNYSYTFLNKWNPLIGKKKTFSIARDAINNFKFFNIYWYISDLSDYEKSFYLTQRNQFIDDFYSIINSINNTFSIYSDENQPSNDDISRIEDDTCNILKSFSLRYWG